MILLAIVGGYVATSMLLLRFPYLLHRRKNIRFRAINIAHRGGAGENLENTLTAFRHAVEVGCQMLELDCHITRDGQVVVCHDEDLTRITGQPVVIMDTLYQDLPLINNGLRLDFHCNHVTQGGDDRRIPLLREVFESFPGIPINIDIKVDNDDLINKVSELTVQYNREDITVWGNRSSQIVHKCYAVNPNIPVLFSVRRVLHLIVLFYTGLLPFVPLTESFYEIIMPSILLKSGKFPSAFTSKQRIFFNLCDFILMNRLMFAHLRRRGIQTYLWVLNDDEEYERAFYYGADGIMTDFPSRLSRFLENRPDIVDRYGTLHH